MKTTSSMALTLGLAKPAQKGRLGPRLRWAASGWRDRAKYGALVVDGEHTHATRALGAAIRDHQLRVDAWALAQRLPREAEIARLRTVAARLPIQVLKPQAVDANETLKLRVSGADEQRNAVRNLQREASAQEASRQAIVDIAQREAEIELILELADNAKALWVEYFNWSAGVYARARSHRTRGARSTPTALVPTFENRSS